MQPTPADEAVRTHLTAILSSPAFVHADRMSRFLTYTVEMKLRGEEAQIKEFLLGLEVFDRGKDYDPRLDPIVRVEARRLRQRLAEYYEGPGAADPIRIEFPKGGYAPVIQLAQPSAGPRWRRAFAWGGVFILLSVAAVWLLTARRHQEPAFAVLPARWVWEDTASLEPSDEPLAEAVTAALANRGRTPVIGWPVMTRFRGTQVDLQALSPEFGVGTAIIISVRREAGRLRVTTFRLDALSGRKEAARDYFAERLDEPAARDRVAGEIASALEAGQPRVK